VRCLSVAPLAAAALALASSAGAGTSAKAVRIDASASPWTVLESKVVISGRVTPHPAGIELTLQQQQGTGWLSVGDKSARADGAFSFVAAPSRAGLATYRVVAASGTGYVGTSASVPVRVLRWQYVTSIDAFAYITPISGNLTTTAITADGVRYEHPLALDPGCYNQWGGNAWIDYLLERQYKQFSATVGLDDASPANETATFSVVGGDGKKLASGSLVHGTATKIKVSVDGEYRLRLWINVPDPNNAAGCSTYFPHVVFGDAQLLGP
jgi:NPCBM/NEW2 domain-containing protein